MTVTTRASIDISLFYRLLDVDEDAPLFELVRAARQNSRWLPHLLLSVLVRDGVKLGSGSADELARAYARLKGYEAIREAVQSVTTARVIKGSALGRHYPTGLCRPVGDLDLTVPGEEEFWAAAAAVTSVVPADRIDVSLFGPAGRHLVACMLWPASDPILDEWCSTDICTAAYCGDAQAVGASTDIPDDPLLANLLWIAEEKFQRPFNVRDVIDVLVLSGLDLPPAGEIAEAAENLHLAPELADLLAHAAEYVELGSLAGVVPELETAVAAESARRASVAAAGGVVDEPATHGLLLRQAARAGTMRRSIVHDYDDGRLLLTPVGDYLLVDSEIVSQSQFDAAMAELGSLGDRGELAAEQA